MKRIILFFVLFTIIGNTKTNAQNFIGMQQSNYSGAQGMQYNPAKLAQNKLKFSIDLFGVDATLNNNQYMLNKDSALKGTLAYKVQDTNAGISIAAPLLDLRLPSFQIAINNKLGVGFSSRVRIFNQLNDANPMLINFANSNTINLSAIENINDTKGFNMNIHALADFGLSAGYNLLNNKLFALNVGASARMYKGVGYFNFNDKGIVGQLINATATTPAYINVSNINLDVSTSAYDYNKLANDFSNPSKAFNTLFKQSAGNGFGGDLGAELIIKGKNKKNYKGVYAPYKIKLGGSVQDIGAVKYRNVKSLIVKGSGVLNGDSLSSYFDNIPIFKSYLNREGFILDSITGSKTVALPTRLQLYADYAFNNRFFVAASAVISAVTAKANNPYYYNQITVAPRFETRAIEVTIPISYNLMSNDIKPGLGCRFGPLYFGSGDLKLLLQDAKGGNVYAGARIALNKKRKKTPKAITNTIEIKEEQIVEVGKRKEPEGDTKTVEIPAELPKEEAKEVAKIEEVVEKIHEIKIPEPEIKLPEPTIIKEEIKKKINFAAKAIQFQTAKAIILKTSNVSLDKVVAILKENQDCNLSIEGHTDNVGSKTKNLLLSKIRAEAVRNYFIKKGIAANRLTATGFGDSKPIADNKTVLGKKENRRVDLKLGLKN